MWRPNIQTSPDSPFNKDEKDTSYSASTKSSRFRILSLDGGGIKGAFSASVLAKFESNLRDLEYLQKLPGGDSIVNHFDLVVGTSTGGIIALGLACGWSAEDLRKFYVSEGPTIFSANGPNRLNYISRVFNPKFDIATLRQTLQRYFPVDQHNSEDRISLFKSIPYAIAIPSFDAVNAEPKVFKTSYHASLHPGHNDLSVADVALATAAAPTYFAAAKVPTIQQPETSNQTPQAVYIDGGVWANCPVMVGITEAMSLFKRPIDEIDILSIGTTSVPTFVKAELREGGLLHWVGPAVNIVMHAAKRGTLEQARKLCRKLVRVDHYTQSQLPLDEPANLSDLMSLGHSTAEKYWEEVKFNFFSGSAEDLARISMNHRHWEAAKLARHQARNSRHYKRL